MHHTRRNQSGPQLTKASLITAIPNDQRMTVCCELDIFEKWKRFVGFIKKRDGSPRYTDLHIMKFASEAYKPHGSPTDSVLKDWQTLRPTIGDFMDLLKSVELVSSANYLHQNVLGLGRLNMPVEDSEHHQRPQRVEHDGKAQCRQPLPSPLTEEYIEHSLDDEFKRSLQSCATLKNIPFYTYEELERMTAIFDQVPLNDGGKFLGKGGYGEVFMGVKKHVDADEVELLAVKRFNKQSMEYLRQFKTELELIFMNCHHPNLLAIKGFCIEDNFCVVYEYMDNGTLEQNLMREVEKPLNSAVRLQIAIDVANGISKLHYGGDVPIVHRDIKPANILLGGTNLNAKVGDYGLVRVQTMQDGSYTNQTENVLGSRFYMPPEANDGIVTMKWDVYSFGVILLEILLGKGPVHKSHDGYQEKIVTYLFEDFEGDKLSLLDDKCDWDPIIATQLIALAERCSLKRQKRPDISGKPDSVLETLQKIQEEAKRLSR